MCILNTTVSINEKTYSETCIEDNECNNTLGLICNNGNPCNCPLLLSNGNCDCERTPGNENYWSGSECLPVKTNLEPCFDTFECSRDQDLDCLSGICKSL